MSTFDAATYTLRAALGSVQDSITNTRKELAVAEAWDLADRLAWRTDQLMELSCELKLLLQCAAIHESVVREHSELTDAADATRDVQFRARVAAHCMRAIVHELNTSSNGAHALHAAQNARAARSIMDRLTGLGDYAWSTELFADVFSAMDAREAAEEVRMDALVTKITAHKLGATYCCTYYNRKGTVLSYAQRLGGGGITRKDAAKQAVRELAEKFHSETGRSVMFDVL